MGNNFINHYNFFEGKDPTLGYNTYVDKEHAETMGLYNVSVLQNGKKERVVMTTAPTPQGPRKSIRLEGKTLFNSGLFIIDLQHMPVGCGVWPAFWMTNEKHWPKWGEIDIIEGINYQPMVKTALHTSKGCTVNDIPPGKMTGKWDIAVGIPNTYTGIPETIPHNTTNCWRWADHQWINQGCVEVNPNDGTLGVGLNQQGGGVYAMEWAPENGYIRSWAFVPHTAVPKNLKDALATAKSSNPVDPDPSQWPLPYSYFPIGTCSETTHACVMDARDSNASNTVFLSSFRTQHNLRIGPFSKHANRL